MPMLQIAIVGSGPAGFFCADYLLRLAQPCQVHMFERWPVPYGSVRHAIAPDRQRIRAVTAAFDRTATRPDFKFFGNVSIGADLSLEMLRRHYHAVILTTGADQPRRLQIPGEGKEGLCSINKFAGWYNGRLDAVSLAPDLNQANAVIIGAGNAALDALRILSLSPELLQKTEIPEAVQYALRNSQLKDIHLIARRGPLDVRFSLDELEELCRLPDLEIVLHPAGCLEKLTAVTEEEKEQLALYKEIRPVQEARRAHLHFHSRATAFIGLEKIAAVELESGGEASVISTSLVITAIGQTATPIEGLVLDSERGIIPHQEGRVTQHGEIVPGLYTAGWAKRSGVGVIGRNKPDCRETVQSIIDDRALLQLQNTGLPPLPERVIDLEAWQRIDKAERLRSPSPEKTRECFLSLQEMLEAAGLD
ncbi:MAG: FAD-dependent oxidoreductase [Candidatus Hydrogenedens sp.]|nr:FAD-dependent oxidoreductase [Candidatus Hydrogenedens sp.]